MSATGEDYCDLCDLPRSQCIHGQPPPTAPKPGVKAPPKAGPVARRSAPRTASPARSASTAASAPQVRRRWTPPDALKPHILAVLREAGGELEAEDMMLELEIRLEDRLLAGDREATPEGEPRWQYAARRARQALAAEGLMGRGRPGVWQLTPEGRRA